ncbi:hypothetical protein [Persephonella sp.]
MDGPITAYIAAAGFAVVSVIIIVFLIREMIRHYSQKNGEDKD